MSYLIIKRKYAGGREGGRKEGREGGRKEGREGGRISCCLSLMFLQVFVGKADSLHDELMKHFDSFGQKRHKIREIDDELCHHTDSSGWNVRKLNEREKQTER